MKKAKKAKKHLRARKKEKTTAGFKWGTLKDKQKDLLIFGLLFILLLVFFSDFIFENKTVKAPDTLASEPLSKWGRESILEDRVFPFWIPYLFSGMPSYGSFVATPSYPVAILVRWILNNVHRLLGDNMTLFIMHLLFAGTSLFYFMRSKKLDRFSSFIAAVTFIFTCQFIGFINAGHTIKLWTISYIPLMFLLVDRLLEKPSIRRTVLAGMVFGMMMMARHVQMVYYFLLAVALFVFFMLAWEFREKKAIKLILLKLLCFGGVIAIGMLLAAFLYLPIYEYSAYSIRGSGGVAYDYATSWSFHPSEMITFLIPSAYGFGGQTYWGKMPFTDSPLYMGFVPLIIAIITLVYRRDKYTIFFGILGLCFLVISFGKHFPLVYSVLYKVLPFFNKFRAPVTMQVILNFSVAILTGFGVNLLVSKFQNAEFNLSFEKLKKVLIRIAIGLGILFIIFLLFRDGLFSFLSSLGMFEKGQEPGALNQQTLNRLKEMRFDLFVTDFYKMVLLFVATTAIIVLFFRKKISLPLFQVILGMILILDLWLVNTKILKLEKGLDLEKSFVKNNTIMFLQKDSELFRIFPLGQLFGKNDWIYFNLQTIGGYHPAKLKIYDEILQSCLYLPKEAFPINMNLVNLLNVKYLIALGRIDHPDLELVNLEKNTGYFIYRNKTVLPRAFLVDSVKTIKDKQEIFNTLNSNSFHPRKLVILEKELPTRLSSTGSATVTITDYDIHDIALETNDLKSPSLLFLSEIYYPAGWRAFIDGEETEIYKTNWMFRSILLPPGKHKIQFIFRPNSFKIGMWISLLTLVFCVLGIIIANRFETK